MGYLLPESYKHNRSPLGFQSPPPRAVAAAFLSEFFTRIVLRRIFLQLPIHTTLVCVFVYKLYTLYCNDIYVWDVDIRNIP